MILCGQSHLFSCAVDFFLRQICFVPVVLVPSDEEPDEVPTVKLLLVHFTQHTASGDHIEQSDYDTRILVCTKVNFFLFFMCKLILLVVSNFARIHWDRSESFDGLRFRYQIRDIEFQDLPQSSHEIKEFL